MSFRNLAGETIRPHAPHRRRGAYRCPGLVALDSFARCTAAMVAAKLWAPHVRVVAQGIDTLHLFTRRPLTVEWIKRLSEAREEAENGRHWPELEVGGLTLTMRPHGAGNARWLLESDLWAFKISPSPVPGHPTVQLEVRAMALWAQSWRRAAEMALDACGDLCGVGAAGIDALEAQVTRADLCVDFQGWAPCPEDLELFTTRATRRGAHAGGSWEWLQSEDGRESVTRKRGAVLELAGRLRESESLVEQHQLMLELGEAAADDPSVASTWRHGRTLTGFSFGRGRIGARLYDKRREIGVSGKHWMRSVWRRAEAFDGRSGEVSRYLEDGEVWRLEFQLRREACTALEELVPPEPGSDWESMTLASWAHFVGRLDSVWSYLTHQWLRHGRRQDDDRQAVSAMWAQMQTAWSEGEERPVQLHRPAVEAARVVVVPQLAGLLATAAAQVEVLQDKPGRIGGPPIIGIAAEAPAPLPYWRTLLAAVRAAHAYAQEKEDSLESRSHKRAEAMRRRGGHLTATPAAARARASAAARLCNGRKEKRWWEGTRWKSTAPVFVPGQGLQGGTVSLTAHEAGW